MIWIEMLMAVVLVIMIIALGSVNMETRKMLVAMQAYKAQAHVLEKEARKWYLRDRKNPLKKALDSPQKTE